MKTYDPYAEMRSGISFARKVQEVGEANRRHKAILDAALRLGSTLRGTFDLFDLATAVERHPSLVALDVARLMAGDHWPYEDVENGVWRDPRPWFHRIAREVDGCWQDV